MKIVCLLLLCGIFVASCGDNQHEKNTEILRHESAAKMYQEQGQIKAAILEAKKNIQLDPERSAGYLLLANIYNKIGAYTAVQGLLEGTVAKMPDLATELAASYMAGKKYHTAVGVILQYPAAAQPNSEAQRQASMLALAYFYLGDNSEYTKALNQFTSLGGTTTKTHTIAAMRLFALGEFNNAQQLIESTLAVTPDDIDLLILLGEVFSATQEFAKAEHYLSKTLTLLPANADIMSADRVRVLSLLTEVLVRQGRTSEAYAYQKILAEANPEGNAAQERFNDAMKLYQQGNFAAAEVILKELRAQFPRDKNTATLLGMIEFQKGENDKASSLFDEYIDTETSASTVIQAAALVKYRKNQVDDALLLLKAAAERQPGNATILATYGLALLDQDNKSAEAAVILEKSLALNPGQQRIRLALAKRHLALSETGQALAQLHKAYKEVPLDLALQEAYLKTLFVSGQADKAKQEIDLFKTQFPENARGPFIEAWYYLEEKKYPAAEKAFERALAMPKNTEKQLSYVGLAQLYEMQRMPAKAITAWQQAIEADPTIASTYSHWYSQLSQSNKQEHAFGFLLAIENKHLLVWQPAVMLAQLYANNKQWAAAEKHIDLALARSASSDAVKKIAATIYQMEGIDFRAQGKLGEARSSFLKAVKLLPSNSDYLANIIETEIADKKIAEAQKLLNEYPQNETNLHIRQFFLGAIRALENNGDEALRLYLASWQVKPTEAAAAAIVEYYDKHNRQELLAKFIDVWVQALPNSAKATLLKALHAQKMHDDNAAIKWYEKTLELAPNMVVALNNLAWIYYVHKDERALNLATRAYKAAPNSASVVDTYGWILVEQGDIKSGIEMLERALVLGANDLDIKNHLKEAKSRLH